MRLFEAILDANHRAAAGDASAGLRPAEFEADLPIVALSCIDPRLNPLLPEVLGIPEEHFIWLRNAGNIITGTQSSTMRSIALACAVKGGKEIAVIGHTDCLVGKTGVLQLTESFKGLGVRRESLPQNLTEFFGLFASERQNVITATTLIRRSPLIGPNVPIHGLMLDTQTGNLEWLVNGYVTHVSCAPSPDYDLDRAPAQTLGQTLPELEIGDITFPAQRIGEISTKVEDWLAKIEHVAATISPALQAKAPPAVPPRIPLPPKERIKLNLRRNPK